MGFGKHFVSMYEGSMFGAGLNVFAVWGYVIAHVQQERVEFVGFEQDAAYAEIVRLRIAWAEAEVARAPSRLQEGQAQAVGEGMMQTSLLAGEPNGAQAAD